MRVSRTLMLAAAVVAPLLACGGEATERDQWTVWLGTDAPVPTLVDRALVEVIAADGSLACGDCRRQIGLPTDPRAWPVSFGIVATGAEPPRVRVRLYRASHATTDGFPVATTTIDRVALLPPARGDTDVAIALTAECIGVPAEADSGASCIGPARDVVAPAPLPTGRPPLVPGSWSRAERRPCADDAPDGMVCVPGGFFVLGDPAVITTQAPAAPERFVTLSPFFLDVDEVKVGTVRALVRQRKVRGEPTRRASSEADVSHGCTYLGSSVADDDTLPANCVDRALAEDVCTALGKRLPTEAEWEWAAGNLDEKTRHPWGSTGDPCLYSDVGLGYGAFSNLISSATCRTTEGRTTIPPGIQSPGNPRDVTELGIRALGGGVSEWVSGFAEPYDAPCWNPTQAFLEDPVCTTGTKAIARGGAWIDAPRLTDVQRRIPSAPTNDSAGLGVRCARSE